MYTYHVLLLPVVVIALVSAHILLVRRTGIVPPLPLGELAIHAPAADPPGAGAPGRGMKRRRLSNAELNEAARHYDGPYKPTTDQGAVRRDRRRRVVGAASDDLSLLADDRPSTIAQWSRQMPVDFVTTAVSELDGSSGTAGYGRRTTTTATASRSHSSTCRSGLA